MSDFKRVYMQCVRYLSVCIQTLRKYTYTVSERHLSVFIYAVDGCAAGNFSGNTVVEGGDTDICPFAIR